MKLPKNLSDCIALGFFAVAILSVFIFEVTVVRDFGERRGYALVPLHLLAAVWFTINLYTSLYNLFTIDTSTLKLTLPSDLRPGWHFCLSCEANTPPRAYHCNICDRCILRRDHHCIFSGKIFQFLMSFLLFCFIIFTIASCIGYKNYKYYISLLFQTMVACTYASVLHADYIWENMGGLSPFSFFAHMIPFPFYVFGFINGWTLFCNFISILSIIGVLFGGGLFIYHLNLLIKNQTTYEKHRAINVYNLKDWSTNLTQSLGTRWPLTVFVSPLIDSPLVGNGIDFPTLDEHKFGQ